MSNHRANFAERLREERERAGLSQYALAKMTGLSKQALSHLELGKREPTWQTVQLLALALGVDCRTFADPDVALPEPPTDPPKRGRPRKPTTPPADQPGPSATSKGQQPAAGQSGAGRGKRKRTKDRGKED